MKHPSFSYRTGFILTGISLVFVVGAIAGTQLTSTSSDASNGGLLTDLKSAMAPEALAGFNVNVISDYILFANYLTWPHSATLKADDTTAQTVDLMMLSAGSLPVVLTDFNGDGLVDVLYRKYNGSTATYYGVFLNNGNLGSTWAYKCAVKNDGQYYGDCASI